MRHKGHLFRGEEESEEAKVKGTSDKLRQDNRITADFVELRETLNVRKEKKKPRISRITRIFVHQEAKTIIRPDTRIMAG